MPSLYLISCRMFEDELVNIFEREDENTRLLLVENENIEGIENKFTETSVGYEKISVEDIASRTESTDEFVVVLNILEFALDADPSILKEKVYMTIEEKGNLFDGILIFYGLCGNVLGAIESDFAQLGIPVRILKDDDGNIVDDCICAAFGNRGTYVEAVTGGNKGEGIYFLTPMQAANWKEMLVLARMTSDPDDIEMTKMVFDYSGYKNVGKVSTGLCYEKKFDETVDEFASLFDFEKKLFEGSTKVADQNYESIKKEIMN